MFRNLPSPFVFIQIGEFDLAQEATPIVDEQLLKDVSRAAKSSAPKAAPGISKDIEIVRKQTSPHEVGVQLPGKLRPCVRQPLRVITRLTDLTYLRWPLGGYTLLTLMLVLLGVQKGNFPMPLPPPLLPSVSDLALKVFSLSPFE